MPRSYIVQKRDTMIKIAKNYYGDPELYKKLADYNGILNPDTIRVGQTIEIPAKSELMGMLAAPPAVTTGLTPPNGLEEILATFGNIYNYLRDDGTLSPRWEVDQLAHAKLPFPLILSWDHSKSVTNIVTHRKLVEIVPDVFSAIEKTGQKNAIKTYGGCFNFRSKRTSGKLSTHSWGIAIDLNPETNPQGKDGDMPTEIIKVFLQAGFKWGGDWTGKSKDPMHFQYCIGY